MFSEIFSLNCEPLTEARECCCGRIAEVRNKVRAICGLGLQTVFVLTLLRSSSAASSGLKLRDFPAIIPRTLSLYRQHHRLDPAQSQWRNLPVSSWTACKSALLASHAAKPSGGAPNSSRPVHAVEANAILASIP